MQALIPPLGRLKQKDYQGLEASLCYRVSPRSASATQEDPASKNPDENSSSILTLAFEEF